jgi:hypothetical protein
MQGKVTLLRYHAAQGLRVVQRRQKEQKEWMAFCKEEGLGYRTVYNALRLAEAVDQAVAEGRFRPEDLATYGWNQALRTFGVKPRKPATAEEEDATTNRKSGGGSRRPTRQGKGDGKEAGEAQEGGGQKGRSTDNLRGQEKKLPDLPHKAAEEEVGRPYPPRELAYQCRYILKEVAGRAGSIDWKQEDVVAWRNSISGMRGSIRQIEEALDRAPKATLVEKERIEVLKAVAVEVQFKYGRNRQQAIAEWTKRTAKKGLGDKPGEGLSQSAYYDYLTRAIPNDNR